MFPCSRCGLCCQNISNIEELKNYDLGSGVCRYFDVITNKCKVYEIRPNICRVDEMFKKKYNKYFTQYEFYIENAKMCNNLQEQYKFDKNYRVKIK